nr:hypothetical protein [Patescibacteria group bacterium]
VLVHSSVYSRVKAEDEATKTVAEGKSFEEFLKTQGDTLYRGEGSTVRGIPAGLENVGLEKHKESVNVLGDDVTYLSNDKAVASRYGNVSEFIVDLKNPLVLERDIDLGKFLQENNVDNPLDVMIQQQGAEAVKQATKDFKNAIEKAGYDGVIVDTKEGKNTFLTKLFHGTTEASAKLIDKEGFKFGKGVTGKEQTITKKIVGDVVYFAETPNATKGFERTEFGVEPSIVEISSSNLKLATPNDVDLSLGIKAIDILKQKGFDGLRKGSNDIAVWNIDKIKTKSELNEIYNKAKGETDPTQEPARVEIGENIQPGTPLSKHIKRTKEDYNALVDGVSFTKISINEQAKKAFGYIQRSPNEALKVAYGMEEPPEGLYKEAVQISIIESLKSAGKTEQALSISRRLSLSFTSTAQKLNLAKLDIGSAGERRIEGIITNERLEKIGNKIPAGPKNLPPRERTLSKIKNEAAKAARDASADFQAVGMAEGLLSELKLTGVAKTKLSEAFDSENITVKKLYDMTSDQRLKLLEKHIGDDAQKISASFEAAMLSNQKQALRNWIWKNVYEGKSLYK